jgi:hypothetical protein
MADVTINNDSTLEELRAKVDLIVRQELDQRSQASDKYWFVSTITSERMRTQEEKWYDLLKKMMFERQPNRRDILFGTIAAAPSSNTPSSPNFTEIAEAIPRAEYFLLVAPDSSPCLSGILKVTASIGREGFALFSVIGEGAAGERNLNDIDRLIDPANALSIRFGSKGYPLDTFTNSEVGVVCNAGLRSFESASAGASYLRERGLKKAFVCINVAPAVFSSNSQTAVQEPPAIYFSRVRAILGTIKNNFDVIGGSVIGFPTSASEVVLKTLASQIALIVDELVLPTTLA